MIPLKSFEFLKGLTIGEAMGKLGKIPKFKLVYIRVTKQNNVPMICTRDFVKERLNVWINVDYKITDIVGFG